LRLRDAAIEFAAAVEAQAGTTREWDRLRRAALRYQDMPRARGRMPALGSSEGEGARLRSDSGSD
jgi:hypothetical protein